MQVEIPMTLYQIIIVPTIDAVEEEFYYYYGSTSQELSLRLSMHKSLAKRNKDNSKLHEMMRRPGFNSMIIPVESFDLISRIECKRKEQSLIETAMNDPYCLNQRQAYKFPKVRGCLSFH